MSPKPPFPQDCPNDRVEALLNRRNAADRRREERRRNGVDVSPFAATYQRGVHLYAASLPNPPVIIESLADLYRLSATG